MIALPPFIDPESWEDFVAMRKKIKKPLTERAAVRALAKLYALKEAGHDPNASLTQSADFYWQDLYEPKEVAFTKKAGAVKNEALAQIQAHEKALQDPEAKRRSDEARRAAVARIPQLRRVG